MKALLDKAVSAIGSYARSNQRRLDPAEGGTTGNPDEYLIPSQLMVLQDIDTPGLATLTSDGGGTSEGDDVLFRKNNVLLKHPHNLFKKASRKGTSDVDTADSGTEAQGLALDNHILIPGFLFVTTRGSNFGTTLILNWAPNSSMTTPEPQVACSQTECSPEATSINTDTLSTVQSCSSISIDLGSMEMIRIFYRMDDSGFILSGELVIKSKEENFKVSLLVCLCLMQD